MADKFRKLLANVLVEYESDISRLRAVIKHLSAEAANTRKKIIEEVRTEAGAISQCGCPECNLEKEEAFIAVAKWLEERSNG